MLNADLMEPTSLQMEAHLAHKARQLRMFAAALPLRAIPAPAPESTVQHDAHVWTRRDRIVEGYAAERPLKVKCITIQAVVSGEYQVTITEMISAQRFKHIILPRHIAIYLSARLTGLSLSQIAVLFGDRDHTTIINARRKMAIRIELDLEFKDRIQSIEARCLEVTQHLFDLARPCQK